MKESINLFMEDMGVTSPEDIKSLYEDYLSETGEIIDKLSTGRSSLSCAAAHKLVHNLKGVSANLYVNDVYQQALQFDTRLKECLDEEHLSSSLISMMDDLLTVYSSSIRAIKAYFSLA